MKKILVLCLVFVVVGKDSFAQKTKKANGVEIKSENELNSPSPPPPPPIGRDVFSKVEVEAAFPGGFGAWKTFLQNNLNADIPVINKAPLGHYTVIVKFVVGKTGRISYITTETNWGYGMEQEVIRIMKMSPNWTPAEQDGKAVNAYRRQPITFVVTDK